MEKNIRRDDWETLEPTIFGWGIVDVNYNVQRSMELPKVNGKRNRKNLWVCPYYEDWYDILRRCLSHKYKNTRNTYEDVSISPEWQYLSNFIAWVDSQPNRDWQNCEPDKDLMSVGDKCYSPETVVYVPERLNLFIVSKAKGNNGLMLGAIPTDNKVNKYRAKCSDPFTTGRGYIGIFPTELEAHKAWQAKKHEHACALADLQQDERVAKRLREMYAPDKDWTNK